MNLDFDYNLKIWLHWSFLDHFPMYFHVKSNTEKNMVYEIRSMSRKKLLSLPVNQIETHNIKKDRPFSSLF